MRDLVYFLHLLIGLSLVVLPILILINIGKNPKIVKWASILTALLSWLLLIPAGTLYLTFYPATKTLILAGSSPWAHEIGMEVKEHLGLIVPLIATVGMLLVKNGDEEASRKWWILLLIIVLAIGVLGRIVTMGAGK